MTATSAPAHLQPRSPAIAISSDRRIVLREKLVNLHVLLGVFVTLAAERDKTLTESDLERVLLALSDTLDAFFNR